MPVSTVMLPLLQAARVATRAISKGIDRVRMALIVAAKPALCRVIGSVVFVGSGRRHVENRVAYRGASRIVAL